MVTSETKNNPAIVDAKAIAKKYDKEMLIIFYFDRENFGYVSYGADKGKCDIAREIADEFFCCAEETLQKLAEKLPQNSDEA